MIIGAGQLANALTAVSGDQTQLVSVAQKTGRTEYEQLLRYSVTAARNLQSCSMTM